MPVRKVSPREFLGADLRISLLPQDIVAMRERGAKKDIASAKRIRDKK